MASFTARDALVLAHSLSLPSLLLNTPLLSSLICQQPSPVSLHPSTPLSLPQLDDDGFVPPGEAVVGDDTIMGKTARLPPSEAVGHKINKSTKLRAAERGIVDQVMLTGETMRLARPQQRHSHSPQLRPAHRQQPAPRHRGCVMPESASLSCPAPLSAPQSMTRARASPSAAFAASGSRKWATSSRRVTGRRGRAASRTRRRTCPSTRRASPRTSSSTPMPSPRA